MIKKSILLTLLSSSIAMQAGAETDFEKAYHSFDENSIKADVKLLSSDEFGGRAPSTEGEKLTVDYLVSGFKALGLDPGNKDSYTQAVSMVQIESTPTSSLTIADMEFEFPKNFVASSRKTQKSIALKDSPLVFVGYGINAPEYNWNDYQGVDVKGKTVVILVNDPGYATQKESLFEGNTMTYYGRWTYKYEEAARQGAAGAIIVHETAPASYGWNVIESSWTGPQFHLPVAQTNEPSVDVEMWISVEKAKALFAKAGVDFYDAKKQALAKDFKAIDLKNTASISIENNVESSVSDNVIATIKGSEKPDEHIIYMGHWDHLGETVIDGKKVVFNGAHDNATGTAGLVHIANAYKQLEKAPKRSVTFIAVTAEEQGRLGSRYFASNPTMPLNKIVGLINMDSLSISGMKKDISVVGFGKSELEIALAQAAKRQNRTLSPEPTPERGYYYRSDHFSLALKGVPALSAGGGLTPLNVEEAKIAEQMTALKSQCYHQACDEYSEDFGWAGMIQELQLFFETGLILADGDSWPNWREGTEFKAARDAMMK
nr:M28 family metallopeptidase [Thalassotalea agarivorans]